MSKKVLFVSDFDGTISEEDFYWMMIDRFVEEGRELYTKWKDGEILDIKFLEYVFNNINQPQEVIDEIAKNIKIDLTFKDFTEFIKKNNGEICILSAGATYYIEKVLEKHDIDIDVYSNNSVFENDGIYYKLDENHKHYSERYGIDKEKVVKELMEEYDLSFYAGDSEPDLKPSLCVDLAFTKGVLTTKMNEENKENVPFKSFSDVKTYLIENYGFEE